MPNDQPETRTDTSTDDSKAAAAKAAKIKAAASGAKTELASPPQPPAPAASSAPLVSPSAEEDDDDDGPMARPGEPLRQLEDQDLDMIAEVITAEQIDRLVRLRARLGRRDEYRAKGISPRTHIVMLAAATVMRKGQRATLEPGQAVPIAELTEEDRLWLLDKGHAERPE
jgi:hypothetical protein